MESFPLLGYRCLTFFYYQRDKKKGVLLSYQDIDHLNSISTEDALKGTFKTSNGILKVNSVLWILKPTSVLAGRRCMCDCVITQLWIPMMETTYQIINWILFSLLLNARAHTHTHTQRIVSAYYSSKKDLYGKFFFLLLLKTIQTSYMILDVSLWFVPCFYELFTSNKKTWISFICR